MAVRAAEVDDALVRVCDLAGRPRGTGFLADGGGTLITSHEAVDGLARLVLHAAGDQVCLVEAEAITPLPEAGLALVATEGLNVPPLPIAPGGPAHPEGRIRLRLPRWTEGAVVGTAAVTYTATDRFHLLEEVYELDLGGATDMSRVAPQASGSPLIDAATGAVLAVVATALHAGHRAAGFAVPLRARGGTPGPLAELLARNAATVPAYGPHLNLAGALQLTATSVGSAAGPGEWREPISRTDVAGALREFLALRGDAAPLVLGLVGDPGTGRSTELAELAARRARGPLPAPTVWLRGAELRPGDGGIKDAVERSLRTAARIVGAAAAGRGGASSGEPPYASPDAVAELARAAGRPLLVLLDAPEEMPPLLAHALADWTAGTASWLRAGEVRMVVACRPEYWEQAGALLPARLLHAPVAPPEPSPGAPARTLPPCLRLGALPEAQAARARTRYKLPLSALASADAAHPLALRLLSEIHASLPEGTTPDGGPPSRPEIFAAHLDLVCLRIAVRLAAAAERPVRGGGVRRLAARVAGQVHEAARRCLGPGQGELEREAFEELFPWRTGWASAVLTEGLLVPAGAGYRFAHEELADWLQGLHLDLDAALQALVHRWFTAPAAPSGAAEAAVRLPSRPATRAHQPPPVPPAPSVGPLSAPRSLPVPRHRVGPVIQSMLLTARQSGPGALVHHLEMLVHALDHPPAAVHEPSAAAHPAAGSSLADPGLLAGSAAARGGPADGEDEWDVDTVPNPRAVRRSGAAVSVAGFGVAGRRGEAVWWAARLLGEVLLRVPDAAPYRGVLRLLAERITVRAVERGGFTPQGMGGLGEFGPWFWRRVPLPLDERLDLLRLLLPADPPPAPGEPADPERRFLAAVADTVCASPREALPAVCGWFADDRPLQAGPGADTPRLTVASAAQALLHTHRRRAVDDLTEALVAAGHPGADDVLAALAEDEPSAICRAVDRWAHDPRPDRHVAAASYGRRAAPFVRSEADRELLRYAALAILARPGDCSLHGAALGLLVRDPATRARHLPAALGHFAAGDPQLPVDALAAALATHPEPVLAAFQARLREPGEGAAQVLAELAEITGPALARRAAALVQDHLLHRPEGAAHVARYLDARLEQGPGVRAVLLPLTAALLRDHTAEVRRTLVPVLAAPGSHVSRPLRQELLDMALAAECDASVLDALLTAACEGCHRRPPLLTRDLVHRLGLLLGRTPEGAAHFDRRIVELAHGCPDFSGLLHAWLAADTAAAEDADGGARGGSPAGSGGGWDTLIGPSARRRLDAKA